MFSYTVFFTLYCAISSVWVEHEIKKAFNSLPPSVAFTKSAVPSCHFSTEYGLPKQLCEAIVGYFIDKGQKSRRVPSDNAVREKGTYQDIVLKTDTIIANHCVAQ